MKRHISLACAAILALEVFAVGAAPAVAAPMVPAISADHGSLVTDVQYRRRPPRDNDAAALLGGLAAGAIIGGIIASEPRYRYVEPAPRYYYRSRDSAHVEWCLNRYRSYDPRSDTYQPYNGPRRYCYSPYS